jgi:hypothetical protein
VKALSVEIVTRMMTTLGHCSRCALVFGESGVEKAASEEAAREYPPELYDEVLKLSAWIAELKGLFRHRIHVSLVDAHSLMGIYKSLRHRFRRYPAFIIAKREVIVGWDKKAVEEAIQKHITAAKQLL